VSENETCNYSNPTYIHLFFVFLYFVPVKVERAYCAFRIRAAPVCSAIVSVVALVRELERCRGILPRCRCYSRHHFGFVLISLLDQRFHGGGVDAGCRRSG
jgi:hypothetical protein